MEAGQRDKRLAPRRSRANRTLLDRSQRPPANHGRPSGHISRPRQGSVYCQVPGAVSGGGFSSWEGGPQQRSRPARARAIGPRPRKGQRRRRSSALSLGAISQGVETPPWQRRSVARPRQIGESGSIIRLHLRLYFRQMRRWESQRHGQALNNREYSHSKGGQVVSRRHRRSLVTELPDGSCCHPCLGRGEGGRRARQGCMFMRAAHLLLSVFALALTPVWIPRPGQGSKEGGTVCLSVCQGPAPCVRQVWEGGSDLAAGCRAVRPSSFWKLAARSRTGSKTWAWTAGGAPIGRQVPTRTARNRLPAAHDGSEPSASSSGRAARWAPLQGGGETGGISEELAARLFEKEMPIPITAGVWAAGGTATRPGRAGAARAGRCGQQLSWGDFPRVWVCGGDGRIWLTIWARKTRRGGAKQCLSQAAGLAHDLLVCQAFQDSGARRPNHFSGGGRVRAPRAAAPARRRRGFAAWRSGGAAQLGIARRARSNT